jgi:hypothetical protein
MPNEQASGPVDGMRIDVYGECDRDGECPCDSVRPGCIVAMASNEYE